jgi:hypothetical protein
VSIWESIFSRIEPHDHLVQYYDDERLLIAKVGQFLATGWHQGDALVTVATARHNHAFVEQLDALGIDARDPERARFLDANEMLECILVKGQPDWARFDQQLGAVVREFQTRCGSVRAFGEMAGLLWSHNRLSTALRIEEFWTRVLAASSASLFCAYPIDFLARQYDGSAVNAILRAHTHLLPFGPDGNLAGALQRAMDEILGVGAVRLRKLIRSYFRPSWAAVPDAEAMVLWIRGNLPQYAQQILARTRLYCRTDADAQAALP